VDVRAAVADFHASHYSANLMKLAVYGRQPVGELAALVERLFSGVPNKDLAVPKFAVDVLQDKVCVGGRGDGEAGNGAKL
jgi:insulysin